MGWAGLDALAHFGGWAAHAAPLGGTLSFAGASHSLWDTVVGQGISALLINGSDGVAAVGYGSAARVYLYSGRSQRLCVMQLAFQAKNFIDTLAHGDGMVFALHHVATGTLAYLALVPYLHLYAPFFFGISEICTLFVAILVNFDETQGIKEMADRFPMAMNITGAIFATLFILFRVVVWPVIGLHFWRDGLSQFGYYGPLNIMGFEIMIGSGSGAGVAPLHSPAVVGLFLLVNIFLTFLQIMWLKEIYDQAILLLSGRKMTGPEGTKKKKTQ